MAELYERIEKLCAKKGVSITEMCKQSGASRGSLTDLKKGRIAGLSLETLEKLMKYFEVSLPELLGTEKEKGPADNGEGLGELLEDLRDRPDLRGLLDAARVRSPEQVNAMTELLKQLKGD